MTIQDVLGRSDLPKLRSDAACLILWRMAKGKENETVKTSSEDIASLMTAIGIPTNGSQALSAITKCRDSSSIELTRGGPGRPATYRVTAATRKRALQAAADLKTDLLPEPPVRQLYLPPMTPSASPAVVPMTQLPDNLLSIPERLMKTETEPQPIVVTPIAPSAIAEALFQMIAEAEEAPMLRAQNLRLQAENVALKSSASVDFTDLQKASTKAVEVLKTLAARSGGGDFEADSLRSWLAINLAMKPFEVKALAEDLEAASKGAV